MLTKLLLVRTQLNPNGRKGLSGSPSSLIRHVEQWWNNNISKHNQEKMCRVILKGITASDA
jgi:hypothetical protein